MERVSVHTRTETPKVVSLFCIPELKNGTRAIAIPSPSDIAIRNGIAMPLRAECIFGCTVKQVYCKKLSKGLL
jgi:hypothetical protein